MANTNRRKYDNNTKIAVLYGGMSNEREVSLRSGKNVHSALLRLGYKNAQLFDVEKDIAQKLSDAKIEVAYNALHGKYGEDGCIQGLLEIMGIEYTGCGVFSSAACMNKSHNKTLLQNSEVPLIKSVLVKKGENVKEKVKELNYPLMLKPVSEGSSLGIYKVDKPEELEELFSKSAEYNQDILIEEFLTGFFVTVGVLDDEDETFATEILEIRTKTEWYNFEAKYTEGLSEFILPAKLSPELTELTKKLAIQAHKQCDCKGVSRVDFIMVNGTPYFLEVNTSPGMTDLSDLPAQTKAMDISYDELVLIILNNAGLNK